jgi:hypothetical protein
MAAVEVIRYIDTDSTGGSGTTWSNAYNSITAWEAAEQINLVTSSQYMTVYCRASSGTIDTSNLVISGWTASSDCFVKIIGNSTFGYWNTTCYTIINNTTANSAYRIQSVEKVWTKRLQIQSSNLNITFNTTKVSSFYFESNIIKGTTNKTFDSLINGSNLLSGNLYFWNNIIHDSTANSMSGILLGSSSANYFIYNNTIINTYYGIRNGNNQSHYIMNNRISSTNSFYSTGASSFVSGSTVNNYNYVTSSFVNNAVGTNGAYSQTFYYVASSISNFTPTSSDPCLNVALDLSGDLSLPFSDDILGKSRPSNAWDIGAHELGAIYAMTAGAEISLDTSAISQILQIISGGIELKIDGSSLITDLQSIIGGSEIDLDISSAIKIIHGLQAYSNTKIDDSAMLNILGQLSAGSEISIDVSALLTGQINSLKKYGTVSFKITESGNITLKVTQSGSVDL